jgi:hypothetical protein
VDSNDHYAFFLHFEGGGYVYCTVYTIFDNFGRYRREVRSPDPTSKVRFSKLFESLDAGFLVVDNSKDYDRWLHLRGWALVEQEFARKYMPQWLASRECIASPSGSLVDVLVASPSALSRGISKGRRAKVLSMHAPKCFVCGSETRPITMHHVRPFSLGGETTSKNLLPLCEPCNQAKADKFDHELYKGPVGDLSLVGPKPREGWYFELACISSDLMFTRSDLY